jgi:hypothetical protein
MAETDDKKTMLRPEFAAYPLTAVSAVKIGAAMTTILVSMIEFSYGISMTEKLVAAINEIMTAISIVAFLFIYEWIRKKLGSGSGLGIRSDAQP